MSSGSKFTLIFLTLALLLFLYPILPSGALSQERLDRNASAAVAGDPNSLLKLDGFQNNTYNMNNKYSVFGSITNNTNRSMLLTITIKPQFSNTKNGSFGIKIGDIAAEFANNSLSSKQITLTLLPGRTATAQAYIDNNLKSITAVFQFQAADTAGTYSLQLGDTLENPRRIILE